MTSLSVLLISSADDSHQVLVASDEGAYRQAFCAFVEAWGHDAVWFDEESSVLGSDTGVTMSRWRARWLGRKPRLALVVLVDSEPADVYLVEDASMAKQVVLALEQPGVTFDLIPLEALPPADTAAGDPFASLPPIRVSMSGRARPLGPRAAFTDELCGRCEDHPLYEVPLFDATLDDGSRVCIACGTLAALSGEAGS